MHEVEVLGTKFQKYKNKHRNKKRENRSGNEISSSDDNSAIVENGVNKPIDEYSHSDSETSSIDLDSSEKKHKSRKQKYRWTKCSHSHRHTSKRKRRKHHRNRIQCEDERPNCEMCAGGRANDMKVAFSFDSQSKCQNEAQRSE